MKRIVLLLLALPLAGDLRADPLPRDDGYRGIWYFNQPTRDEYRYKYSGGMATYPQQHAPIAIYREEVRKTFFCYGGTTARKPGDPPRLLHMVSYYDHEQGTVPRPVILLDKATDDAHDNPVMQIDARGIIWIFSNSHGTQRPAFIHRSITPYSIDAFARIAVTNFSYGQPWQVAGRGFLFLHTGYVAGRRHLRWMTSPDGLDWSPARELAFIDTGDYQVSWARGGRVATAFDFHPSPGGLNARANLYYLETTDLGGTWRTANGQAVTLPLTKTANPALVYDSRAENKLVYLKDLNFDAAGRPVVLFLTSHGFEPGPASGPREWKTARWTGSGWVIRAFTESDNNYDHGSLYLEPDGAWRVIAPTQPGPQPFNPGGEMVMWSSQDEGTTWRTVKQLTTGSARNHSYARRPLDAHPAFYALWADGHGRQPSESNLYFTDRDGTHVWRLPPTMAGDEARPEIAW
jgi:hypothetical protein